MPSRANDSFLPARGVLNLIHRFVVKCQCPLGLMTHFYDYEVRYKEGREVCQCPLGLMTHFYETGEAMILSMIALVSMPSRANDSFLQYPFKNLGFMRFPEPVFAGICLNILTDPHFHACLQFGHI